MYLENIEESPRFILTINIFYSRGYFCAGILRLDFFFCRAELSFSQLSKVKRKFLDVIIQKFSRGPSLLRRVLDFYL